MAGYALSRLGISGRDKIYFALLALMMIPGQVLLIPNYLIMQYLGLLDSYSALIIPAAANIGNIFMMRQFFINFPRDVEEAAHIDGLSGYGTFFRICMPLAKPVISTQAIFIFMGFWNEFTKTDALHQDRDKIYIDPWFADLLVKGCGNHVESGHGSGLYICFANRYHLSDI